MEHFRSLNDVSLQNAWLTIGSFDGVHLGHQEIISNLVAGAHRENAPAVVLTFFPHPSHVLRKRLEPVYLTSPEERAELLGRLGVDVLITNSFNATVASTSARDFVLMLVQRLGLRHLWVGYDFALGKGREGNPEFLRRMGDEIGFRVHQIQPVLRDNQTVSSSLIRQALMEGDVQRAASLLGRFYEVKGEVVRGDGRGRGLGFPTANMAVWAERIIPKAGVYVCKAVVAGKTFGAVTNVGVRPTFEDKPVSPRVEAHLLDFDGDIYGEQIRLDFLKRIRDERRFPQAQALIDQVNQDKRAARDFLAVGVSQQ